MKTAAFKGAALAPHADRCADRTRQGDSISPLGVLGAAGLTTAKGSD